MVIIYERFSTTKSYHICFWMRNAYNLVHKEVKNKNANSGVKQYCFFIISECKTINRGRFEHGRLNQYIS